MNLQFRGFTGCLLALYICSVLNACAESVIERNCETKELNECVIRTTVKDFASVHLPEYEFSKSQFKISKDRCYYSVHVSRNFNELDTMYSFVLTSRGIERAYADTYLFFTTEAGRGRHLKVSEPFPLSPTQAENCR